MDSEDIREVEFLVDHVVYKGEGYTDSKILVTSEFIQLEIRGCIIYKWVIANIVHITSCWDECIQSVIVKICADIDGVYTPGHTLEFAVGLPSWNRKLKEIKSLNDNYKSLWKNYIKSEDTNSVPGHNGSTFEEDIPCTYWELVYPKGDTDAITITQRDIDLLQPKEWLNNTIIDFYLKYLRNEMDPDESHRFHFLSSFFFSKMATHVKDPLVASKGLKAFQHVKRWTEKVDLFKKEFIFMPIIYNGHWSLIVILNFGELAKNEVGDVNGPVPCVLHLDSLRNNHAGLKEFIHSYLREEWKSRASENISRFDRLKFIYLKQLPQQENGHDCGLFLLHYAQLFLEEFLACSTCQVMDGSKFLKADWFTPSEASDKRMAIKQLIYDLKEKQKSTFNVDNDNQYEFRCRSSQDNQENGLFSFLDNHCYVDQFSCPTEGSIPQCVPGSSEDYDYLSALRNDFYEDYKLSCPTEGSIPPGVPGISEDDLSAEIEAYYRCV